MATTKNVLGTSSAKAPGLVGINLTTAAHLAAALEAVAAELDHAAGVARAVATEGLAPTAAVRLGLAAVWATGEAATLRSVIARLDRVEATGVARWSGGRGPAFADPVEAHRLAGLVLAALAAGRLAEARAVLAAHSRNPVLATVLVAGLGADGLLELLHPAVDQWARTGGEAAVLREVVLGVAGALALALRHGTSTVAMADLVAATERAEAPLAGLALLFVGGARFPTTFLRDAATQVVAPLNALVRSNPGVGVDPWLVPARGAPLDARVLVLRAVARDHEAAVQALGAVDLDDLLPGSVAYLDGGVALAEVVREGTTPLDTQGRPVVDPLVTASGGHPGREGDNARRVIEWIGAHQDAPLAEQASLGRIARPWIGAFRSAGLDTVVARPVVVEEVLGRAYLTYGQALEHVAAELQDAAWTWAAAELPPLSGADLHGVGFDAVGSVLGVVTITGLDAEAALAEARDRRIARSGALWRRVTGLAVDRLPSPARPLAGPLAGAALDRLLEDADHELRHWSELRDLRVAHEYLALDYLVASVLWSRREDNGLLDPPPHLLASPSRPDAGLRHPLGLDATDVAAWTRWRSAQADDGPAPRQMAGDQFLAETRE